MKEKFRHRGEPDHLVPAENEHLGHSDYEHLVHSDYEHLVYGSNDQLAYGSNDQLIYGEPEQLVCRSRAGNPPARLHWFRGQQMLHSKYRFDVYSLCTSLTYVLDLSFYMTTLFRRKKYNEFCKFRINMPKKI